jgi:HlyD family secretion protein
VLLVLGAAAGLAYWLTRPPSQPDQLMLYGNVDLRQVDLAFNGSERIAAVLVQEGDAVHKDEVLAKLDTSRLEPQAAQAAALVAAQRAVVANLVSAKADAANARLLYQRQEFLLEKAATTQQNADNAKAALDVADAKVEVNQKALDLAVAGPRIEDVAQGEAQLRAVVAQWALVCQQLADATLRAPADGIIRSRLLEPGDMASPQKPAFSLAIVDPKWVRAYVSEPDLGKVHPGMKAYVMVDGFPQRHFAGWVGFISPVAEFTPKTVQTAELRTSLVYEVRVFVADKADDLRLGMPATVYLQLKPAATPRTAGRDRGIAKPDGRARPQHTQNLPSRDRRNRARARRRLPGNSPRRACGPGRPRRRRQDDADAAHRRPDASRQRHAHGRRRRCRARAAASAGRHRLYAAALRPL